MTGKTKIAGLFFLLVLSSTVQGVTLGWDDIVVLAKTHNQDLKNAELSIKQAEIEYSKAATNLYPKLSTSAGYSLSGGDEGGTSDAYALGISGSLPVFSGFSDVTELQIQKVNKAIERENYFRTYSDVLYGLKTSYINLLTTQEMLALWQNIQKQRTDNYNLVKLKYQAGREDRGAMLRMEADKLQADYELANAKRDSISAMLELMRNIGIGASDTFTVTGSLVVDSLPSMASGDSVLGTVPEYRLSKYKLESTKLKIRQAKSGYYPDVSLSSGYSMRGSTFPPDYGGWNVGLSLSYPLTGSLTNKYQVNTARNSMAMSEHTFEKTALTINASIQSARNDLLRAVENIIINEKYLAASKEQSLITSRKYMNGLATYTEWYSVETDYVNAKKNMLSSRKNAILLRAKLANIMGEGE
ncbi:MAG: TolC family protein [bacterium]|nr:TolC family protein [bacterium]